MRSAMAMLKPRLRSLDRPDRGVFYSRKPAMATMSTAASPETRTPRIFVDHTFYKGKAAMNMKAIPPTFKLAENGEAVIWRDGALMLAFAPSIGLRQYDWSKKQIFALSITELGQILSMTPADSLELFHDPSLGKPEAGNVRKTFKVVPTSNASGYFFNLDVTNNSEKSEFNIPILKGEFAVLRSAASYLLPFLMGWLHVCENNLDGAITET